MYPAGMDRRSRPRRHRWWLPLALLLTAVLGVADDARPQEEVGARLPVAVQVTVDESEIADTGIFVLGLEFTPKAEIRAPYIVRVVVSSGDREVIRRDHTPDPPTTRWRAGQVIRYDLPTAFPLNHNLSSRWPLDIELGFLDPETGVVHPPEERAIYSSGLASVGEMAVPVFTKVPDLEHVERLIARAREFRGADRQADAWDVLELGIRMAEEDSLKYRLRDELLKLSKLPPRPLTMEEEQIVRRRIDAEKARYFRLVAGGMYDREEYHGALALLEQVGGSLAEQADQAVIGALDDADRLERDLEDVRQKLFDHLPPQDLAEAEAAVASLGLGKELLKRAEAMLRKKQYGAARRLFKKLRYADAREVTDVAFARIPEVEKLYLEDQPSEQMAKVEAALDHPSWERTAALPSHRFIFIGPRTLVEAIPKPSLLRFDLAYIFLTDLFGRVPNPAGDRVTVYFKELWDFGGGVGGGKIIDIGKVDPERKGQRVDTGLLYHELTHCVDDTAPILAGFREGLANVGAAYCFEAIGQEADGLHSFERNLDAFKSDYLGRDLEYWRIQNYGPSAGFFLHFLEQYSRSGRGHDWKPYRRFFREYREAPVRDGRDPFVARSLAYFLVRAFGPLAFDDLRAFRFPLTEADREAVSLELEGFDSGRLEGFDRAHESFPNSPLPRDLLTRELRSLAEDDLPETAIEFGRRQLGIIYDWKIIGPFSKQGVDPGAAVFPPEYEIKFDAEYLVKNNICTWREPQDHAPVIRTPIGWIRIEFNYQDNTATYALCHVTSPVAAAAVAHIRADDDLTLFVNDLQVGAYRARGTNSSSRLRWRGPYLEAPDAIRLPFELAKGRNKLLLKIRNRYGPAGFSFALSRPDGRPVPGLATDLRLPDLPVPTSKAASWKRIVRHDFRSKKAFTSFVEATVGSFRVIRKALSGSATAKQVEWRKYTVRPGFPKDSPSNLGWLRSKITHGLESFRLEIGAECRGHQAPKLLATFQGEGGTDGLSGWNLILLPGRKGHVSARLERYDRLVYQCEPRSFDASDECVLTLTYSDERATVTLNECVLFEKVPIRPIPGRHRIGFATWGAEPRIAWIELERPD